MASFSLIVCFSIVAQIIVAAAGIEKTETGKRNERDIAVYPVQVNKVDDSVYRLEPSTLLKMMKPNPHVYMQPETGMRSAGIRADEVYNDRNDIATDNSSSAASKTEDDNLNAYEQINKKFEENLNVLKNLLNTLNTSTDRLKQIADSIKSANVTVNAKAAATESPLLSAIDNQLKTLVNQFNKSFTDLMGEINAMKVRLNILTNAFFETIPFVNAPAPYGNQDRIYYTNGVSYQLDGNGNLIPIYKKLKQRSREREADIANFVYEYNLLFFKVAQRLGFLNDTLNEPDVDMEKLDLVIHSVEIISKTLKEPYFNLILRHKEFYGKKLFLMINDLQKTIHNANLREGLTYERLPLVRKSYEIWLTKLNRIKKALTNLLYDNDMLDYETESEISI